MVALSKLLLLGAMTLGSIAAPTSPDLSLTQLSKDNVHNYAIKERTDPTKSRMKLYYSSAGQVLLMLGANFPQSLLESFMEGGQGPAKVLFDQFRSWLEDSDTFDRLADEVLRPLRVSVSLFPQNVPISGALYGVGASFVNDFGLGMQFRGTSLTQQNINDAVRAIYQWATSHPQNVVEIVNLGSEDFANLATMGASIGGSKREVSQLDERSRTAECPAKAPDILNYANLSPPEENEWNKNFRFAPACPF